MREILFRGKRFDNGEWIQGYYLKCPHQFSGFITDHISVSVYDEETKSGIEYIYPVKPDTVGQYTGLTDSNGRKIFEGDIVKLTDKRYGGEWYAQVVFGNPYSEYSWGWNFLYIGKKPQVNTDILLWVEMEELGVYCEVIGNIHDNQEI